MNIQGSWPRRTLIIDIGPNIVPDIKELPGSKVTAVITIIEDKDELSNGGAGEKVEKLVLSDGSSHHLAQIDLSEERMPVLHPQSTIPQTLLREILAVLLLHGEWGEGALLDSMWSHYRVVKAIGPSPLDNRPRPTQEISLEPEMMPTINQLTGAS